MDGIKGYYFLLHFISWLNFIRKSYLYITVFRLCFCLVVVFDVYIYSFFSEFFMVIYSFIGSVQFSRSVVSNSLRPHEPQHARPPCPSPTPGVHSNTSIESVMPSSHLILCRPLLLLPLIPPSISLFQWVNSLHEVAKVLEFQL